MNLKLTEYLSAKGGIIGSKSHWRPVPSREYYGSVRGLILLKVINEVISIGIECTFEHVCQGNTTGRDG